MPFSGFQDLDPRFAASLQQMFGAYPGLSVMSGYRSPQHQAELFHRAVLKYGSEAAARHWVAPPGHSMHNFGDAADLQFASSAARDWAHAHAADYGLRFRMGHEPWHIEPIGGRNPNFTPIASGGSGVPAPQPTSLAQSFGTAAGKAVGSALGDVVAPQAVNALLPPTDMGSLAFNFLQQAEERRQREEEQQQTAQAQQRAALFSPPATALPASGVASLYG